MPWPVTFGLCLLGSALCIVKSSSDVIWRIFKRYLCHTFSQLFRKNLLAFHNIWHIISHTFWHIFWHSIPHVPWHMLYHFVWHCICQILWHCIWRLKSGGAHCYGTGGWGAAGLTVLDPCVWGPAVLTAIGRPWWLRSSGAHCDPELAKRIGEKLGQEDGEEDWRGGGAGRGAERGAGRGGGEEEEEEEEEEE